jgi:hypothetical protein
VAAIPIATEHIPERQRAIVSGWGQTSHPGTMPERLQFVEKMTLSNKVCKDMFNDTRRAAFIHDNVICAFGGEGVGMTIMQFLLLMWVN